MVVASDSCCECVSDGDCYDDGKSTILAGATCSLGETLNHDMPQPQACKLQNWGAWLITQTSACAVFQPLHPHLDEGQTLVHDGTWREIKRITVPVDAHELRHARDAGWYGSNEVALDVQLAQGCEAGERHWQVIPAIVGSANDGDEGEFPNFGGNGGQSHASDVQGARGERRPDFGHVPFVAVLR